MTSDPLGVRHFRIQVTAYYKPVTVRQCAEELV